MRAFAYLVVAASGARPAHEDLDDRVLSGSPDVLLQSEQTENETSGGPGALCIMSCWKPNTCRKNHLDVRRCWIPIGAPAKGKSKWCLVPEHVDDDGNCAAIAVGEECEPRDYKYCDMKVECVSKTRQCKEKGQPGTACNIDEDCDGWEDRRQTCIKNNGDRKRCWIQIGQEATDPNWCIVPGKVEEGNCAAKEQGMTCSPQHYEFCNYGKDPNYVVCEPLSGGSDVGKCRGKCQEPEEKTMDCIGSVSDGCVGRSKCPPCEIKSDCVEDHECLEDPDEAHKVCKPPEPPPAPPPEEEEPPPEEE
eukprot:TRINITY_DN48786_c0_g1_i1.p1 TRINITY_DN48786_c0_g1~~TRINITY_DN48786_c0_g1_i1.p1  ORF type:complete len:305 (-),score=46.02 TRINITY_DN48786_c0_g1_i1:66-980(-)